MPLYVALLAGSLGSTIIGSGSGSCGSRTSTAAATASTSAAAAGTVVGGASAAATPAISLSPSVIPNLPRFSCQPDPPRACTTRKISFSSSPRPRAVAEIAATAQLRRLPTVAAAAASAAAAAFPVSAGPAAAQTAAPGGTLAAAVAAATVAATASLDRARGRTTLPTNATRIRASRSSGSSSSGSGSINSRLAGKPWGNFTGGLLRTFPATLRHSFSDSLPSCSRPSPAGFKSFRGNMSTSDTSASDPALRPVGGLAGGAEGEGGSKEGPQQQQQHSEGAAATKQHKHTNRLANEQSPYLLQHAHNPVDWYPWGEEAFAKARAEDKLIFLSVGYSTCHWCHVMEVESFESEEIAAIMNKLFVNVKVDREERPDVDKVYMTYVQATQGGGGWPMSVFLTPTLHPVLGATYFPPEDRYGRPGFKTVLQRVAKVWSERRDDLERGGREAMEQLAEATAQESTSASTSTSASSSSAAGGGGGGGAVGHILEPSLPQRSLQLCFTQLASRFDERRGGFGSAPKFPRPSELTALLWRFYRGKQQPDHGGVVGDGEGAKVGERALHMMTFTLEAMARGGMHDHVGGGFHRYSVDEYWHVPHFEKMLYDQGQLANAYLDAFAATADVRFAMLARDVLDYVLRDLTHPDGGFYSAEDADSLDVEEGKKREGSFYVWKEEEIDEVLGGATSDRCRLFKSHYYVKGKGNCDLSPMSDPHSEFVGKNCLIERASLGETAKTFGIPVGEAARILGQCRKDLHAARAKRPRPHLDDKVIVAWNGLMISALARASRVLKSEPKSGVEYHFPVTGCVAEEYLAAAANAANFIRTNLFDPATGHLKRSFREGPSKSPGFADDYAFLVSGLLDLFEASGDTQWLAWATRLQNSMDELMWDDVGGGYYNNAEGDASILLRMKEDYDGAEPSPNSYAVSNLVRLAGYVGGERGDKYRTAAARTAAAFRDRLAKAPLALPHMCAAVQLLPGEEKLRQVVIAGAMGSEERERLHDSAFATFCPDKLVIPLDPASDADRTFWEATNKLPLAIASPKTEQTNVAAATPAAAAAAAAYVCQNFTCLAPTSDPECLKQLLAPAGASTGPKVTKVTM